MKRARAEGALVVLNLLAVIALVGGLRGSGGPEARPPRLPQLGNQQIDRLLVEGSFGRVELVREQSSWDLIHSGRRFPAREDRIDAFLDVLLSATIDREIAATGTPNAELDAYGLGPDARRITISTTTGDLLLQAGDTASGVESVYMIVEGRIVLVSGAIDFYLSQSDSFWAYLRVLPESVRASDVIDLVLTELDQRISLDNAGAALVLADLVGGGFYDGAPPSVARAEWRIFLNDGREFVVWLAETSAGPLVWARGPALPGERYGGLVYTLPPATLERLRSEAGLGL